MEYEFSKTFIKKVKKLKKDKDRYKKLNKKIQQIILLNEDEINHFKNLKAPLQKYKRVHFNSHFVIIFQLKNKKIIFKDFNHHDKIYEEI
jgi:YafQ family addiction module toxin component